MNIKFIMALLSGCAMTGGVWANPQSLPIAIQNARDLCSGISSSMNNMKTKAGINTGVTAVGTVAGGVALGTGIYKAKVDEEIKSLEDLLRELSEKKSDPEFYKKIEMSDEKINALLVEPMEETVSKLEKKSKTLGNVRTGTLAASTVTNIVGTAIAATNKVEADLEENIYKCTQAIKDLSQIKLAAKVEGTATDTDMSTADKIVNGCRDYEMVDLKPINKRATGAAVSSGIGVGTGVVGTITSAVANSNSVRNGDYQKEKAMNTTANVMAGASTVASATATIFNATQISAIKKVVVVADTCEGALQ